MGGGGRMEYTREESVFRKKQGLYGIPDQEPQLVLALHGCLPLDEAGYLDYSSHRQTAERQTPMGCQLDGLDG